MYVCVCVYICVCVCVYICVCVFFFVSVLPNKLKIKLEAVSAIVYESLSTYVTTDTKDREFL